MRNIVFYIVLQLLLLNTYSQSIVFKYTITKDSSIHVRTNRSVGNSFFKIVKNNWDNVDPLSLQSSVTSRSFQMQSPTKETDIVNYRLNSIGTYVIVDIYGHPILIDPSLIKDTVKLIANFNTLIKDIPLEGKGRALNDSVSASTLFKIIYPEKYKYLGFFDSLAYLHGGLHDIQTKYSFKQMDHNLAKYLPSITMIYNNRINFFKDFVRKYGMPANLQLYARKEIQYSYYAGLLEPLVEWDSQLLSAYPKNLQDTIQNFKNDLNNNDLFKSTMLNRYVMTQYITLMNRGLSQEPVIFDASFLEKALPYSKRMLKGNIKSYAVAWLMKVYTGRGDTVSAKTIYQNYERDPNNPSINRFMDSVYNAALHPNIDPQQMLNLTFENAAHNAIKFGDVAEDKLVMIDCWATWCIPCLKQMPYLYPLVEKYKDRVQFVSLSADQDLKKWDTWLKQNATADQSIVQLHARGGFQNIFFKQLLISTIPRYILVSNSGKILNLNMPMPSETAQFEKELNKNLIKLNPVKRN